MPLIYSPTQNWASVTEICSTVTARTESPFTLNGQVVKWPGTKARFIVSLPAMKPETARMWAGWLASLNGRSEKFPFFPSSFMMRQAALSINGPIIEPALTGTGSVAIVGTPPYSGATILTSGWTGSAPHFTNGSVMLSPGQWVSIGGRLHKVTSYATLDDVTSPGTNLSQVSLWPPLAASSATTMKWKYSPTAYGEFRLDQETPEISWRTDRFSEPLTFAIVEA